MFNRIIMVFLGYNELKIKSEMKGILHKSCYRNGMALYTFNGDSQRYWKLNGILAKLSK